MTEKMSDWEQAVEYGNHLFGSFPTETGQCVTGVLHYNGNVFESYVDSGQFKTYTNWIQEYGQTPLSEALEDFVRGEEMNMTECVVNNTHFEEKKLTSAGMGGWRYEFDRKQSFKRSVLRSNTLLDAVVIFNRYGEVYCPIEDAEMIRETYWEYVDENYEHRHSHQAATKNKAE